MSIPDEVFDHAQSDEDFDRTEALVRLAIEEDIRNLGDLTCEAMIDGRVEGEIQIVSRQPGVLAGSAVAAKVFEVLDDEISWSPHQHDGDRLEPGTVVATLSGSVYSLLMGERTALNFLTHLSGVATLTRQFVDAIAGTRAAIYDTRKTLPGLRRLQKAAVRAGGGTNHRMGLYDGVLIKDNHLAAWQSGLPGATIAAAVRQARKATGGRVPIEVEVDNLDQLSDALQGEPDVVLLDNMDPPTLVQAVQLRDTERPATQLEASGGIRLDNVAEIAHTGVDRISIGALTHSAPALDLAFDWSRLISPPVKPP